MFKSTPIVYFALVVYTIQLIREYFPVLVFIVARFYEHPEGGISIYLALAGYQAIAPLSSPG